ncbi:ribbon-helix-helix domain-containing protein [Coleofasciculus sp. FACHB-542]|uniref:ribbon-helix-helix domain-containing protein n=1 Tax=Coleofasciculus sp. FACHB-542 TaxID=2692787 RepID=UPI001683870F|nr:ribbon-helix-helix domain-containing protein [Coleofasciculus sp. FACHB-542]MBD2087891.1 CopG family transcriptional regulator [Coleofasciculus sp. FACHB-542]
MAKDPMVGARIPQEYIEEIDALSQATGRSRSQIILEAVEAYLGKESGGNVQSELAALRGDVEALKKKTGHLMWLEAS